MSKIAKSIAVLGVVAGLGVAALPLSSYAAVGDTATSGPVTVRAEVSSSIAVTAADELVDLGTINVGTPIREKSTTVTVTGTGDTKYNLTIADADAQTALVMLDEDGNILANPTENQKIPTNASLTKGTSAWAVKGGALKDWTVVPAAGTAGAVLVNGGALPTATADELTNDGGTLVTFGVTAGSGLKDGVYQDQVIFTATVTQ